MQRTSAYASTLNVHCTQALQNILQRFTPPDGLVKTPEHKKNPLVLLLKSDTVVKC